MIVFLHSYICNKGVHKIQGRKCQLHSSRYLWERKENRGGGGCPSGWGVASGKGGRNSTIPVLRTNKADVKQIGQNAKFVISALYVPKCWLHYFYTASEI